MVCVVCVACVVCVWHVWCVWCVWCVVCVVCVCGGVCVCSVVCVCVRVYVLWSCVCVSEIFRGHIPYTDSVCGGPVRGAALCAGGRETCPLLARQSQHTAVEVVGLRARRPRRLCLFLDFKQTDTDPQNPTHYPSDYHPPQPECVALPVGEDGMHVLQLSEGGEAPRRPWFSSQGKSCR